MQAIRINNQVPQVFRVVKASPTTYATTRNMSLFPRYFVNDFAPATNVFRLLDEYASQVMDTRATCASPKSKSFRSFSPKFDITETQDSYELHGELPGIEQQNVNIEFTDAQTLTIKGRSEHHHEEGARPAGLVESKPEQDKAVESSQDHYQKPSVEDEGQASADDANVDAATQQGEAETEVQQTAAKQNESRYWLSERSVGEFARTFSFRSRVDQDRVKASLKDGILSIVVPKAPVPTSKRINIE